MFVLDQLRPGRHLLNLYSALFPYFLHPFLKILQLAGVTITVILSVDRYIVVFHPYHIYRHFCIHFDLALGLVFSLS